MSYTHTPNVPISADRFLVEQLRAEFDLIEAGMAGGSYTLPVATASTLGGVKQGTGVTIDVDGVISAAGTSGVTSVNTRSGAVTLTSADVGLPNVDNTSDVNKPVSTAQATADGVVQSNAASDATTKANAAQAAAIAASAPAAHVGAGGTAHANAIAGGAAGFMSGTDKTKLDGLSNYTLPVATTSVLGGVKQGTNITIDGSGVISSAGYTLPVATGSVLGGVKIGSGLTVDGAGLIATTGSSFAPTIITTNTSALAGNSYVATAALTLTLPAAPGIGSVVYFENAAGANCTVGRNSELIMGLAEDLTLDNGFSAIQLVYLGGSTGWALVDASTTNINPLPIATASALGGVKVGTGLAVDGTGLLSATAPSLTAPGPIGSVTPSTGAFTTLSASSTVSGAGFSTYLASPPAIGGTAPAAGSFTTLTTSGIPTFDINAGFIGKALSGYGGNWRYKRDTGTVGWLTGILGAPGDVNFNIYDLVNSKYSLLIVPNSAEVTINTTGLSVAGTLSATGDILLNKPALHPKLTLQGTSNGGAIVDMISSSTQLNWRMSNNTYVVGAWELTPSTAAGGSTFTTPVLTASSTGLAIAGTLGTTGAITATVADSAASIGLKGTTKGLRLGTNATGATIDGVDSTLMGSYQPLTIQAAGLTLNDSSGTGKIIVSSTGAAVTGALSATGGINSTTVGATTASTGAFTTLSSSTSYKYGTLLTIGDASDSAAATQITPNANQFIQVTNAYYSAGWKYTGTGYAVMIATDKTSPSSITCTTYAYGTAGNALVSAASWTLNQTGFSVAGTITGSNLSGTNTGDNAANSQYSSDYRAANFVAGTHYIAPTGSIGSATGLTSAQVTTALGFTPGSAAGLSSSVISTNTTATAGGVYVMTASLTLTLPASPSAGNYVRFSNMSGVTTCVIGRNGQNIMAVAEDLTVDQLYAGAELMYADATRGWVFV